ncbi:STY0301 family protein [Massilia sp.]|uniref:STY0301 family protein n=1 Tax=Massilia sp. TaxID=1882437 RepID=UPI0028AEF8FF|nr:STY0301 family protein [Massilia sp.]
MKLLSLAVSVFSLVLSAQAAEQRIECPARYPAEDIPLRETGDWDTGLVPADIPLEGGGMFTGPLVRRAELRGSERRIRGGYITNFGFNRDQDPPEKWFVCHYGHVQLARRIADTTTACELTHKERKFPKESDVRLICR